MPKFGLKLWSTNAQYFETTQRLYGAGAFDYVELYVVPGSAEEHMHVWTRLPCPYYLHAPHYYSGLNLSDSGVIENNRILIREVDAFRTALHAQQIIFHPGVNGSVNETVRQMHIFSQEFPDLFVNALIENKPKIGLKGEICIGAAPEEILQILQQTNTGFCFDIGHGLCYAAWKRSDWSDVFESFMALQPVMYHLSDGDSNSQVDSHLHLGEGNYDLRSILTMLPHDATISIETSKEKDDELNLFIKDVQFSRSLVQSGVTDAESGKRSLITIRAMNWDDRDDVLAWRNHPICRQYSITTDPITPDQHHKWFMKKLSDKTSTSYIGIIGQDKIGIIRFDDPGESVLVSVMLNPRYYRRGFGKELIMLGTRTYAATMKMNKPIIAEIKAQNHPSIKAFQKAGYAVNDGNPSGLQITIL